ncbi:MAG: transporter substrate-binding domain-containing protein [Candidatus Thiodiazotropha sp. (ex Epidulcina cf. delphinae)]|nr:transporter substrate-binding domain-containing protein [Candidatus Thiodiazotropha sp. (ex Epidulcina cf. delphinae)]
MTERLPTNGAGATILHAVGILFFMATVAQAATEREQLIAAAPANFPPHYLLDSNGRPGGYAIDIMDRLAESAGLQVRYSVVPDWTAAMEVLRRGEVDLIPNLGITSDRSKHFDFTSPLETIALGLFVRAANTDIHSVNDLAGKTVAVVKHNSAVKWIKNHPQLKAHRVDNQEQALFALLSGEVEAMVYPVTVTWKMSAARGVDAHIRQAGLPLLEIKRAVAVRKGNRDLLNRLDQAVKRYTGSEHFRNTYTRWHARSQPFWTLERVLQYGGVVVTILMLLTVITMLRWRYRSILKLNRQLRTSLAERERAEAEIHKLKEQLELVNRRPIQTDSGAEHGATNSL